MCIRDSVLTGADQNAPAGGDEVAGIQQPCQIVQGLSLIHILEQGQLIAAVGATGNAYGNHCHFEVRVNGVRKDPAGYIGTVYNR